MRYIARGLNSLASPGNEIECEQVLGSHKAAACISNKLNKLVCVTCRPLPGTCVQ